MFEAVAVIGRQHAGKRIVNTEGGRVGHTATKTARARSASFARESHNSAVPTVFASDAKKAVNWNATAKIGLELVKHEGGQFAAFRFQISQERRQVFLYRSVKQSRFGTMTLVRACDRVGVTACCRLRGEHQQEFSAARRYWLLAKRSMQRHRLPSQWRESRESLNLGPCCLFPEHSASPLVFWASPARRRRNRR